jgi:hypothetical protein
MIMEDKDRINILIENYKLINEETKSYHTEMMRCFIYTAIVFAIGFGYGDKQEIGSIIKYMPFAILGLMVYFLSLGFMYVNACRYKAQIEKQINKIAGENLFGFELLHKPELLKTGFLPIGKKSIRLLPIPNLLLGIVMIVAFILLVKNTEELKIYYRKFFIISILFGALACYVFLVIPRIIAMHQKRKTWI